jgi:hypothetical protein
MSQGLKPALGVGEDAQAEAWAYLRSKGNGQEQGDGKSDDNVRR